MSLVVSGGLVALTAAGCGSTKTVTRTVTVPAKSTSDLGPPAVQTQFGYIKSMKRKGAGYALRFDPALLLSGITANTAAAEDGAVAPGEPVPNDNYRLNEGHRLLTYLLPANARVSVITQHGQGSLGETKIPVDELARIVNGGKHRSFRKGAHRQYHQEGQLRRSSHDVLKQFGG